MSIPLQHISDDNFIETDNRQKIKFFHKLQHISDDSRILFCSCFTSHTCKININYDLSKKPLSNKIRAYA